MQINYACSADKLHEGFQLLPVHSFPSAQEKKKNLDVCPWEETTQDMQLFIYISKAKQDTAEMDGYC